MVIAQRQCTSAHNLAQTHTRMRFIWANLRSCPHCWRSRGENRGRRDGFVGLLVGCARSLSARMQNGSRCLPETKTEDVIHTWAF
jgi:hypothetical protein